MKSPYKSFRILLKIMNKVNEVLVTQDTLYKKIEDNYENFSINFPENNLLSGDVDTRILNFQSAWTKYQANDETLQECKDKTNETFRFSLQRLNITTESARTIDNWLEDSFFFNTGWVVIHLRSRHPDADTFQSSAVIFFEQGCNC